MSPHKVELTIIASTFRKAGKSEKALVRIFDLLAESRSTECIMSMIYFVHIVLTM
jgi:hypothetical protein